MMTYRDKRATLNLRINPELKALAEKAAADDKRSLTSLIERLLGDHLEKKGFSNMQITEKCLRPAPADTKNLYWKDGESLSKTEFDQLIEADGGKRFAVGDVVTFANMPAPKMMALRVNMGTSLYETSVSYDRQAGHNIIQAPCAEVLWFDANHVQHRETYPMMALTKVD